MPTRIIIDVAEDIQFGPESTYPLAPKKSANIFATDLTLFAKLSDRMHLEQQKLQRILTLCHLPVSSLIVLADKEMQITFQALTQEEFENGRS